MQLHWKSAQHRPKRALITGASSGIGAALATLVASHGVELILTGRDEQKLQELTAKSATKAQYVVADLATKDGVEKIISTIHNEEVDLVVNSAGLGFYGEESDEELEEILHVNIHALVRITRAATHTWLERKKKGVVLNVASALAFGPAPRFSVYAASKAFVLSFSRAENFIYKRHGIYVLTSCPGKVATDFQRRASRGVRPPFAAPLIITPEEAAVVLLNQILSRKEVVVFNWRTRVLVLLGRLFPHLGMRIILELFKPKLLPKPR
jgi:uncharacterized protein